MKLKIRSTEVTVSYLLICLAAISLIIGVFQGFVWCLCAVIIHEIGHLLPMCFFGYTPDKIKISVFEIMISDVFRHKRSFLQNLIIIFSGPFANFICFILFYLLYLFSNDNFLPFAIANVSVGIFNILPVLSLDGGQLLYVILCRYVNEKTAEKIVNVITFIFIFPLAALGFVLLFRSQYNFSLLFVCVYLIFSLICRNNRYY